jgi:trimethylamine--corrinoid protein Co-methyltransferase
MISDASVDLLAARAVQLVTETGIKVEDDEVTRICLAQGCRAGRDRRVRIPREIIDELVSFNRRTQDQYERDQELALACGPDWVNHMSWTGKTEDVRRTLRERFVMQAFDCGATTYYDYPASRIVPVDRAVFESMMKLAEVTPEIGYTSTWYRQDLPPKIERLHSLVKGMRLTKKLDGIEAIFPEVIQYLKDASEIVHGAGSSAFLAGSECMTMPLILERRSAEDIRERKRCGVHRYHVASMPTLGVSTPVTVAGSIVMGAAEILGGMAICWCVDPGADISGRMITLVADMRNGNSTTFGPALAQYNNGVRLLFRERWGGHCAVEVFFSPTAQRPGLQAVFENLYGASCRARWDRNPDVPYAGMGTLHNGGLGSPTQLMLDMEIRKAQWAYGKKLPVDVESIAWEDILSVIESGGTFLDREHTMRHFRELWMSPLFLSDSPGPGWDGSEKAILDVCEDLWRANLARWQPPEWPEETLAAMDALLARAWRDLGIGGSPDDLP